MELLLAGSAVVADVNVVAADKIVLLVQTLQDWDHCIVNARAPDGVTSRADVIRELRLIHVGARVQDTIEAGDVHREAWRRAEHRILDHLLQQVAVAEQSRRRKVGVRAARGRLHDARESVGVVPRPER